MNKTALPDPNQSFLGLTCIQSAAQSLPGMLVGWNLSQQFGEGTALISICIGNLILWLIGLSIISMNHEEKRHAIENVKGYLGATSAIIAALVLVLAFMTWYVLEIKSTISTLDGFLQPFKPWNDYVIIKAGAALGLLTALLAIGGIRLIRRVCVFAFPFLLLFLLYLIYTSDHSPTFKGTWGISLSAVISTIVLTLPGFVNLPTFFRHSRSRADSFLALTLITVFDILFSISTIFTGDSDRFRFHFNLSSEVETTTYFLASIAFIITSSVCLNLVNIYFASAGGEAVFYRNWSSKEYTIIGLLGTVAYTFLQVVFPMQFLENITNSFISCLGIVLLLAFLTRIIVKHRARPLEKAITSSCWYCGCFVSLILQIWGPQDQTYPLIAGVGTSLLCFLCIIFIEETIWSIQNLVKRTSE